ncbi:IclR family transcriptional regulator [Salipiger marinus]|uniref:IclR family transcriptional regulator n=1 Tax=Salipiger marinus TaxID=555512 RepID=UPI001E561758|nr:IclR family transcriptional regulator [Salipiger manganoxidans]MCD1619978.1 IclR family transcriptional regulator [Salipiger manganoxidans]MEB3420925.1 IclR family transcriptional regulator [Salipiger manganoxidans]
MTDTSDDDKYRAPALSKGLDILELLASGAEGLTQVDIAKTLGRTTPEIFRMLMVLRQRGYVELGEGDDRYHLSTKMFEVAHRHPPMRRLTAIAGEAMQKLADALNQSMHLAILHSGRVLVVAQVDCPDNHLTSVRLGAQVPVADTASGRVLAAWMAPPALDRLLAEMAEPEARRAGFLADLPGVRAAGYCESPSLTIAGVHNLSAPVFDFSGRVAAAVTIPFITRLSGTSTVGPDASRQALVEMAADLSRRMGAGARG